ncbi:hypothetical protein [Enterococcus faecalis]|uniref:hypothetical protein n=1 Tax=Enterococcus faecalis TaxID=1351 RepID=UPI003D01AC89
MEYAVYQGENFLFIGTAQECANKLNIKVDSVRWMLHQQVGEDLNLGKIKREQKELFG